MKTLTIKDETWLILRAERERLVQERKEHIDFNDTIRILAGGKE
jgi:hypothetical protein